MAEVQSPTLKDAPKVLPDLKSQLEKFDPKELNNVEPQEKGVLPTAEDVKEEKQHIAFVESVNCFKTEQLRKTETVEKVVLPNAEDVKLEKTQQNLRIGVESFDKTALKHTDTVEKVILPGTEGNSFA